MKGYLQRMVANVSQPQRALHPLVGGMFVDDRRQSVMEESVVMRDAKRSEEQGQYTPALRKSEESRIAEHLAKAPIDDLVESRNAPKVGEQREMDAQDVQAEWGSERSDEDAATRERETILPLQVRTLLVTEGVTNEATSEASLLETNKPHAEKSRQESRQAGERRAAEQRAGREVQRERDDIQIHIGRIEVIAVPAPVQRAAPAAARKTESLEEYLQRRDRRSR